MDLDQETAGFAVQGIRGRRKEIMDELAKLEEREKQLSATAMLGAPAKRARKPKGETTAAAAPTADGTVKPRRVISAEQRQKMSDASKKRWALRKGTAPAAAPEGGQQASA